MQADEMKIIEDSIEAYRVGKIIEFTGLKEEISELPDILHYMFDIGDIDRWDLEREVMKDGRKKVTIRVSYEQSKEMREKYLTYRERHPNATQWIIHVKKENKR